MVDKDRIQTIANEIADEKYNSEFYDLSEDLQMKVYKEAEEQYTGEQADLADALRKGELPIALHVTKGKPPITIKRLPALKGKMISLEEVKRYASHS